MPLALSQSNPDVGSSPSFCAGRQLSEVALLLLRSQTLPHTDGENTATVCFRPRPPPELHFATHKSKQLRFVWLSRKGVNVIGTRAVAPIIP